MISLLKKSCEKILDLNSTEISKLNIISVIESSYITKNTKTRSSVEFCCVAVRKTIKALISKDYTQFDAHTTSNCCHGIALLVRDLIRKSEKLNLPIWNELVDEELSRLENFPSDDLASFDFSLFPKEIVSLAGLYILNYSKEIVSGAGRKTKPKKLKELGPIGTDMCNQIVRGLQKKYSNLVSKSYYEYLNEVPVQMTTCGISTKKWGKYVSEKYLREDTYGVSYAPCMYSMQVILAYLISSFAKIAVINDVFISGKIARREVFLLQGDGEKGFTLLSKETMESFIRENKSDPVIVFGGCSTREEDDNSQEGEIDLWINKFPDLVLACDVFYPEFPKVRDDPNFDCSRIRVEDECIRNLIGEYSTLSGFSSNDPFLFCLTHIYTANWQEVLQVWKDGGSFVLPNFFIPYVAIQKN